MTVGTLWMKVCVTLRTIDQQEPTQPFTGLRGWRVTANG